jgi:hypothetical protein
MLEQKLTQNFEDDGLVQDFGLVAGHPELIESNDEAAQPSADIIKFPERRRDVIALDVITHPRRDLILTGSAFAIAGFASAKLIPKSSKF